MPKSTGNINTSVTDTSTLQKSITNLSSTVNTIVSSNSTTATLNQVQANSISVVSGNVNLQNSTSAYQIAGSNVLSSTALGSNVVSSLLQQVGSYLQFGVSGPQILQAKGTFTNVANNSSCDLTLPTTSPCCFFFMAVTNGVSYAFGYGCLISSTATPLIIQNSSGVTPQGVYSTVPKLRFLNGTGFSRTITAVVWCFST